MCVDTIDIVCGIVVTIWDNPSKENLGAVLDAAFVVLRNSEKWTVDDDRRRAETSSLRFGSEGNFILALIFASFLVFLW